MMNRKRCEMRQSWPNLRHYPSMCLEGERKTTKSLNQDSRSLNRDLNPQHPEYGLLGRRIGLFKGLCLHRTARQRKTRTDIIALSGIRNHDPSIQTVKTHALDHAALVTDRKYKLSTSNILRHPSLTLTDYR
jgi:hypothetical protein